VKNVGEPAPPTCIGWCSRQGVLAVAFYVGIVTLGINVV
jgi:hypothetical protein